MANMPCRAGLSKNCLALPGGLSNARKLSLERSVSG
jgi:hypothetical protein